MLTLNKKVNVSDLIIMLKIINNILDRCFFTVSFIIAMQLPEFIQQYIQRLSGHLNEAKFQLTQFQKIAEEHYQGSLSTMIVRYKENSEQSIKNTGDLIELLSLRIENYQTHLTELTQSDYINTLYQFIVNFDLYIAQTTAQQYALALPLNINAISTGAVLAIVLLIIKELSLIFLRRVIKQPKDTLLD